MTNSISGVLQTAVKDLFDINIEPVLTRPEEQFGDYATNIAMQIAGKLKKNPREIAEAIAGNLAEQSIQASVAGAGFINIRLNHTAVYEAAQAGIEPQNGSLLLEYSCPNAFKDLHVGHLYQTILGDALGRVYKRLGWSVYRVTYGGDVGRHVAASMWAILAELEGENPEKLSKVAESDRSQWLARMYVAGVEAFETNNDAKAEILALNKRIYEIHQSSDHKSALAKIYWTARSWSYAAFDQFYRDIQVLPFDRSIGESETFGPGLDIVRTNIGPVFEESEGAVILSEAKSGLHTRVFITSEGLPTYEAKDLGVITLEARDVTYDKRIIMTGNEQKEYMKVVFAAMKLVNPELGVKQNSLTHGLVKFGDGQKMSSRLGNVTRAVDVLEAVHGAVKAKDPTLQNEIALGAVKYTFLKNSIGSDIAFDLEQSVSLEGNSGPYLQYALVRARAILRKADSIPENVQVTELDESERRLASWLSRYPEALQACIGSSSLHELCGYLYELSQVFNRFYEQSRVIDDPRSEIRLSLVTIYERTLSNGLSVLGMPTPKEM